MKNLNSRRQKLIFSTIGLALAVPLLAVPVSASVADGAFLVHAQNIEEPKYEAYAGIKGQVDPGDGSGDPGDGSGDPGTVDEDTSAVLASYYCGALDFNVTQNMVDFSKANEESSGERKTSPDGWQSIARFVPGEGVKLGFPTDGSTPPLTFLNEGMTTASPSTATPAGVKVRAEQNSAGCNILDLRKAPSAGGYFNYGMTKSTTGNPTNNAYTEGRYVQLEDGTISAARFTKQSNSDQVATRKVSPLSLEPSRSSTEPYTLTRFANGNISLMVALKTPVNGYNHVTFVQNADGSGRVQFGSFTTTDSMTGAPRVGASTRTDGPALIRWNTAGEIDVLESASGTRLANGGPYTAADYNAATGQNWDGSYPSLSDFNSDVTFTF